MLNLLLAACVVVAEIPPEGGVVSGVTAGASALSAPCATSDDSPEHVYQWTAPRTGVAEAQTCSTTMTLDSVVYVREDTCEGAEVVCNDDTTGCANSERTYRGSKVTWWANAGSTYSIIVDGYDNTQPVGAYELTLTAPPPCVPDLVNHTSTPVLGWDLPPGELDGIRVYWGRVGEGFPNSWDEPCWYKDSFDLPLRVLQFCKSDMGVPPQRFMDIQFEVLEFAVKAYRGVETSPLYSNTVTICMPELRHFGAPTP